VRPVLLPPNIIEHFYRGGAKLAALRGVDLTSPRRPEEWLAATVHRAGEPGVGLSRTVSGGIFADLVAADRAGWTGAESGGPGAGPADTGILVKLLDPAQRLPVHVHPDREFAQLHLHSCYGKTEAWYVLAVEGDDPSVWVGLSADVEPDELARRVDAQDSDWLLAHLNKIPVRPGDGILVPSGAAHATGAGVFVLEIQEPTDFSILLEWSVTTATRDESHLGLGFDRALRAVRHTATSVDELDGLRRHTSAEGRWDQPASVLPAAADPFFRVSVVAPVPGAEVSVVGGYAVVVVLDGTGELRAADSSPAVPVRRGEVWAVPAGFGDWSVAGDVRLTVCRPGDGWPGNLSR